MSNQQTTHLNASPTPVFKTPFGEDTCNACPLSVSSAGLSGCGRDRVACRATSVQQMFANPWPTLLCPTLNGLRGLVTHRRRGKQGSPGIETRPREGMLGIVSCPQIPWGAFIGDRKQDSAVAVMMGNNCARCVAVGVQQLACLMDNGTVAFKD